MLVFCEKYAKNIQKLRVKNMAKVIPFKGLRYNLDKIDDLASVTAPPYDIIPPAMQDALYDASEHNVIRLELGKSYGGDNESNNKYTRAGNMPPVRRAFGITAYRPLVSSVPTGDTIIFSSDFLKTTSLSPGWPNTGTNFFRAES